MPVEWHSPNHIDPTATFKSFLITALAGAECCSLDLDSTIFGRDVEGRRGTRDILTPTSCDY